jgi:hypothetical protein
MSFLAATTGVVIPVNLHQHSLVHRGHLLVHLSYAVKLIVDLPELRVHEVGHHVGVSPRDEDARLRAVSMKKRSGSDAWGAPGKLSRCHWFTPLAR